MERYAHKMNFMGLTSSRKESRTNAYTVRILLLDGKVFSSCVRSRNRTRIVVYIKLIREYVLFTRNGRDITFGQRSRFVFVCCSRCVRVSSGALFSDVARACSCACRSLRSAIVGVK